MKKPKGYWTKERCYEAARKCETISEFAHSYVQAYYYSRKNGWMDEYTWFLDGHKEAGKRKVKWDEETSYAASKECKTITEFAKKYPSAYQFALDNDLIDKWFERKYKPQGHWNNYDHCYEAAMDCKTRSEFQHKYPRAWKYSTQNGWIDDYYWFERVAKPYTDRVHLVYGYFFNEQHTVYIGRTYKPEKRHYDHSTTDCPVNRFAKSHNTKVPQMTILEKELTWDESLIYEDLYVEQYKTDGWNLINTAKTGLECGGLGTFGHNRYTREYCWNCAMKYDKKSDFFKNDRQVYNYSYRHGWLNDYTWLDSPLNLNVNQYDLDGNFIKEFSSAKEAAQELGLTRSNINSCCSGHSKSHKGFMFRYTKDCDGHNNIEVYNKPKQKSSKSVLQFTKDGVFVSEYTSFRDAERATGIGHCYISNCCKGKKHYNSAGGFIWRYADEETKIAA